MARPKPLPLATDEIPEPLRRFCDPSAPGPARTMAARGVVPIKGADMVIVLLQLSADPDPNIAKTANESIDKLPENVMASACETAMPESCLDTLAERFLKNDAFLGSLVANAATADGTVEFVASRCSEQVSERIAVNEQRLLGAPRIIEALYKNKQTRMSTADRLIELAARNKVELKGIPAFKAHVEAIQGQLIPEPTEEPLPSDQLFNQALEADSDEDPVAVDEEGEEEVNEASLPLMMRVGRMSSAEKIRLAMVGNAGARALLVRDKNRTVAFAAISSPAMAEPEAAAIAHSKEVSEEILRFIGNKREWTKSHEVKSALVFNPKCPVGISLKFVSHLRDNELKMLAKSRGVAQPVKSAALQRINAKEKKARGK